MIRHHNPEDRVIIRTGRTQIGAGEYFTVNGHTYQAVTNAVGYLHEVAPGLTIRAGMVTDPENPEPDDAVCAIRVGNDD